MTESDNLCPTHFMTSLVSEVFQVAWSRLVFLICDMLVLYCNPHNASASKFRKNIPDQAKGCTSKRFIQMVL